MSLVVAIIAQGAMGAGMASRLAGNGATVLTCLDGRSEASRRRAEAAGMRAVDLPTLAAESEIILSIVPPAEAPGLAAALARHLAAAQRKPIVADCNAVSPETVARIAERLLPTGCGFVDGGIIGGPPRPDGYTPVLYLSGPEAGRLAVLGRHGLEVRVLDGPVGATSALKMSYAGITKGLVALSSAMMLAATRAGAAEGLFRELERSQPQLLAWFGRMVPAMYDKAYRWVGEMEEIADFIGTGTEASGIYRAIARYYTELAADAAGPTRETAALSAFLGQPKGG
jgi:3-hydroxyisobutyrate dehydrogenase-like beta-hydroxyacid dehydrogenase